MNLPIRSILEKNRKTFTLLSVMIFSIFTTIIIGENAVEALLINRVGAAVLPKMYVINAIVLFFVSFIFLHVIDRVNRGVFFHSAAVVFMAVILAARFLIFLDLTFIYPFLYIFSYTTKTVLFIIFWTVANDICDTREAKEMFPLIAGAGILGNTFASIITGVFVRHLHTQNLLYIWAALLLADMLIFRSISREFSRSLVVSDSFKGIRRTAAELKDDFTTVNREPLLRIMAIIFLLAFIFLFNLDFQFYRTAGAVYGHVDDLSRFLGLFKGSYSLLTFVLQFFIVSHIFNRYGISNSMMIVPVVFLSAAVLLFITAGVGAPMFWPVVIATFFRFTVFESIFSPTYQIFFSSVRKSLRGKGKAFIEGIVKPVAIGGAGLAIMFLSPYAPAVMFLFLVAVAGTLLYASSTLKNWYTETLIKTVGGIHYDDFRLALETFYRRMSADILPFLKESLNREKDINVRLFIIEIIGQVDSPESNRILLEAFRNGEYADNRIRASILSSMAQLRVPENLSFFVEQLNNHDSRIRANAIEAITALRERNVYPLIEHYAKNDAHPRVRANALISLWKLSGNATDRERIRAELSSLLSSDDIREVSRALFVLGSIRDQPSMPAVAAQLHHRDGAVRRSAVIALANYASTRAWRLLVDALYELKDDAELNLATAKLADAGGPVIHVIMEHIRTDDKRICVILLSTLRRILKASDSEDQLVILGFAERDKLEALAMAELEHIYRRRFTILSLRGSSHEAVLFLATCIWEKINLSVTLILEILGILDQTDKIAAVAKRIRDADEHVQADVLEILENIGKPEIIEPFLPLIESKNNDAVASIGKRVFGLKVRPMAETITGLLSDPDPWIMAAAINAAANVTEIIGDKSVLRLLRERTADRRPEIRELAARAIKQKSKTIIKSIATKGEQSMLNRDLLKEKFTIVERVIFFKKLPLFKNVDSERLKLFAEIATEQLFRPGEVIVREDDIGEFIYIIKSGRVNVVKNIGPRQTVLTTIPEQNFFGEMGLIDNEPRSASCVADGHCSILIIRKDDFLDVLYRSPELALELFKVFTQRIREGNEKIRKLTGELDDMRTKGAGE